MPYKCLNFKGNDILHELTSYSDHQLKVETADFEGNATYANYATFHVGDELSGYIANLSGFSGTVKSKILVMWMY